MPPTTYTSTPRTPHTLFDYATIILLSSFTPSIPLSTINITIFVKFNSLLDDFIRKFRGFVLAAFNNVPIVPITLSFTKLNLPSPLSTGLRRLLTYV